MAVDISRDNFRPEKQYRSVLMQQGRILTDADWNEQASIEAYLRHAIGRDFAGATGAPRHQAGFALTSNGSSLNAGAGRFYINGMLVENPAVFDLSNQPYLPGVSLPTVDGSYLAYLDVMLRPVTVVEDAAVRDPALGGINTAARLQLVSQIKLLPLAAGTYAASDEPQEWSDFVNRVRGKMRARTTAEGVSTDPCQIGARGGYSGPDNHLYRVEIHNGGAPGTATYKWSRDNAGLVTEWISQNTDTLGLRFSGRDEVQSFRPGQWIEIDDEGLELEGSPGTLARIIAVGDSSVTIDPDTLVHFDGAGGPNAPGGRALDISEFDRGVRRVRRWDMVTAGGLRTTPSDGSFVEIENGITVAFDDVADGTLYESREYWLIPARVGNRNIEWPMNAAGTEAAALTALPVHEYARLAFVELASSNWTVVADARRIFPSLGDANLHYAGGDGQSLFPGLELAEPLAVRISAGPEPIPDAVVRFSVTGGDGNLTDATGSGASGNSVDLRSDGAGLAAVRWTTGADRDSQTVSAQLLDENGQPLPAALVRFRAHKNQAAAVEYTAPADPADPLYGSETTQAAVDALNAAKVNRAGDVISGDLEVEGTLTVRGDMIVKETESIPGDVMLGDQDEDTITIHGEVRSAHSSGSLFVSDGLYVRASDAADVPLRVDAVVQGLAGRSYRRPLTVDNSANASPLTDFQVLLTMDTAALISGGKMQSDGDDLLFLDEDELTSLPYWIESGINTANTRVWVRVPVLPANGTRTIYVLYGNENATARSSKANTFLGEISGVEVAYAMDEGTGTIVGDTSGNGRDAALVGGGWTTGRAGAGTAIALNGGTDAVDLANITSNNDLWRNPGLTIAAWFRADTLPSGTAAAIFDNLNGTPGPDRIFGHSIAVGDSNILFSVTRASQAFGTPIMTVTPGQWYFVALTAEDTPAGINFHGYVNGTSTMNPTASGSLSDYPATQTPTYFALLGNSNLDHAPFDGALDDVRIYNRALSPTEIADLYNFKSLTTPANAGNELLRRFALNEPATTFGGPEEALAGGEESVLFIENGSGNVGLGTTTPGERLTVNGIIETTEGGIKFPDGTIQTTAGGGGGLAGGGTKLPLGTILAWHKNFDGSTPDLPDGWIECNGQTIDDPESPFFGQDTPDLNSSLPGFSNGGRFLRGGPTSGNFQGDQMQGHIHRVYPHAGTHEDPAYGINNTGANGGDVATQVSSHLTSRPTDDMTGNGPPRYGNETRPANMSVVWIMRIKDTGDGGSLWDSATGGISYEGGNVGIGTDEPQAKLHVSGTAGVDGILFPDGTLQTTAGGPGAGLPLGTILAWHKSLGSTPPLPDGWVECNGQTLSDAASPYDGLVIPDLNNPKETWNDKGAFLRGHTTSGEFEDDQLQGHHHRLQVWGNGLEGRVEPGGSDDAAFIDTSDAAVIDPSDDGTNGTPRTGSETKPVNMSVVWIMKVRNSALSLPAGGYAIIEDKQPPDTLSGAGVVGSWNRRTLNTLSTNISGLTLSSNEFTLPAGTYLIRCRAPAHRVGYHQIRLFNVTDSTPAIAGASMATADYDDDSGDAVLTGALHVDTPRAYAIEHWISASTGTSALGIGGAAGSEEVYTQVEIIQLAQPTPEGTDLIGSVHAFATETPPTGWIKCDGTAISRNQYARLFQRIGDRFGTGDGTTTFNVPDLRGEFIRGWDDGRGVDSGRTLGSAQGDLFESHTHTISNVNTFQGGQVGVGNGGSIQVGGNLTAVSNATGGAETRPRNVAMMYCIKY